MAWIQNILVSSRCSSTVHCLFVFVSFFLFLFACLRVCVCVWGDGWGLSRLMHNNTFLAVSADSLVFCYVAFSVIAVVL